MDSVKIIEKRRVFDDIFKVDEAVVEYRKHDGSWSAPVRRLSFERGESVAALLVRPETGRLVLVNQFRYPTHAKGPGWLNEVVAGVIDEGETPETALRREIREETGCEVARLERIAAFYASPGGSSERIFLYYGELVPGHSSRDGGLGVGDEDIKVVEFSPAELWQLFTAGELADASTVIALLWYRLHHGSEFENG